MTRVLAADLPQGLRWVTKRDSAGNLVVYYARWLGPQQRREAVREAQCAAKRQGWLGVLLPAPVAVAVTKVVTHPGTFSAALAAIVAGVTAAAVFAIPGAGPSGHLAPASSVSATAPGHRHRRKREDEIPRPAPDPRPERAPAPLRPGHLPLPSLPAPLSPVTGLLPFPPAPVPSPAPVVCATVLVVKACVSAAA